LWLASRHGEFPTAATDRGRAAALFSYPWLTAALLAAVGWNLAARATILALQPGELWPLVAWLLGAIYLHATSTWRPRRVAAWLATVLAGLAFVAAVLTALNAGTTM
jgi:ABC-type transport system involved in cytochrome c biogenesis permease subunit